VLGTVVLVDAPEGMPEPQAQVWRFFATNAPRGRLTTVDGPLLSGLCDIATLESLNRLASAVRAYQPGDTGSVET
jgi:hypothetical protein